MDLAKEVHRIQTQASGARKFAPSKGGFEDPADEIPRLLALGRAALRQRWLLLFGAAPSPRLGRPLIARAIACRLQERAFAPLKIIGSSARSQDHRRHKSSAEAYTHHLHIRDRYWRPGHRTSHIAWR
jgi:hypothetical protein